MSEFRRIEAQPVTGEEIMAKVIEQTQTFSAFSILKEMVGEARDDLREAVFNPESGIDASAAAHRIGELSLSLAYAEKDYRSESPRLLQEIREMVMPADTEAPIFEFRDLTGGGLDYHSELAERRQDQAKVIGQVANVGEYWWMVKTLDGDMERVFPSHPVTGGQHVEINLFPQHEPQDQELAA